MVDVLEAHGVFAPPLSPHTARPSRTAAPRSEASSEARAGALWAETWAVMDRVYPALRKQRFG